MTVVTAHKRDGLMHSRICEGKMYVYSACEDGTVLKCSRKHCVETAVKPYLKRGMAVVKINQREHTLKNLVAQRFIKGYRPGDYVEVIDGDPFNCAAKNLRLYTKREHGRRTGHRSRSQKVTVDGVEYRSVREAAKALFVSYQTVLDYLGGGVKHSVLQGTSILVKEDIWHEMR